MLRRSMLVCSLTCAALALGDDGESRHAAGPALRDDGPGAPVFRPRAGTLLWSIGEPTGDEQTLLELMNRARMDPDGEADLILEDYGSARVRDNVDFFLGQRPGVEWTREENAAAFRSYAPQPPLAFSGKLIDAARGHSLLLRQYDQQSHRIEDDQGDPLLDDMGDPVEKDLRGRVVDAGYDGTYLAESVFSYASNMVHAHAGFAVDWGQGVPVGQTRPYLGHRLNLMAHDGDPGRRYVEVGVGVVEDASSATDVGPRIVTIDFAQPFDGARFVTGVCWQDADGDAFYDPEEAIPGVRIDLDVGQHYAISSASGGYAIPVFGAPGAVRVTATGTPGTPSEAVGTQTVTVQMDGSNAKADFGHAPEPPVQGFATYASSAALPLADGGAVDSTIVVPLPGEGVADAVGDLSISVDVEHADRGQLVLRLTNPAGTEVLLFDRGPAGADVTGEFGRGFDARGDLGALIGGPLSGTWRLRVEDAVAGTGGTLASWSVHARPAWTRRLYADRTLLHVKKLKVKDSSRALGDSVTFSAEALGLAADADPSLPRTLRLRALDPARTELLAVDLPPESVVWFRDGTSRSVVSAKLKGLDLPGAALPAEVEAEVAIGGVVVRQRIPVRKGAFDLLKARPAEDAFVVDALTSTESAGLVTTKVKGRLQTSATPFGTGTLEVFAGAFRQAVPIDDAVQKRTKLQFKGSSGLRKLAVDAKAGTFSMTIATPTPIAAGGAIDVALRLGDDGFFGAATIRTAGAGATARY